MNLTIMQLAHICQRAASSVLSVTVKPLRASFALAEITNSKRAAMYIAQTAYETMEYARLEENLNYSAEALLKQWPMRFTAETAQSYARHPEKIANHVYADRHGNGDEAHGDGWRYRGRGAIMLTFADNYRACGKFLGIDLLGCPELAASYAWAFKVAAWYWRSNNLNAFSDKGDVPGCTRAIQGGSGGLEQRLLYFTRATEAFIAPALIA